MRISGRARRQVALLARLFPDPLTAGDVAERRAKVAREAADLLRARAVERLAALTPAERRVLADRFRASIPEVYPPRCS